MIEQSDFRIRKLRSCFRIWQSVGSGWEPLADKYQTRAEAQDAIDKWIAADETSEADLDDPPVVDLEDLTDRLYMRERAASYDAFAYFNEDDREEAQFMLGMFEAFNLAIRWLGEATGADLEAMRRHPAWMTRA